MINAFTALVAMASAVNAHMVMRTPTPALSPNNSPLDASGSDFPCKIPGGSGTIPSTNSNTMTIGSPNTLSFTGSAVHGGGSCQVSLAKGDTVNKDTKWMVIHSIEGGCPANVAGNLPADPNGSGASSFQFTVPDHPDLGAGTYTLAWTWHNKIGNREMYMNCASVNLQAATKKRYMPTPPISKRAQAPLPDMFVANIDNGCTVPEGTDVQYPNPGASVEVGSGAALGAPSGNCGSTGSGSGSGSGASSSAAASNTVQPIASSSSRVPTGAPSGAPSGSGLPGRPSGAPQRTQSEGGSFVTATAPVAGASSAVAGAASSTVATAVPSAPAASQGTSTPTSTSAASGSISTGTAGSGSTTASGLMSGPCDNSIEGQWSCSNDGKSWARCASGAWTPPMAVAAGMTCVPGQSATIAYAASGAGTNAKRDIRSHIARRAHNIHAPFFT